MKNQITSFEEFWPFYLNEHRDETNRLLHFIGSSLGLACFVMFLYTLNLWYLLLGLLCGYGFAWAGHFCLENNKPASFSYPLWSFMADWKMWYCMLTGTINDELKRAGIASEEN